VASTLALPPDPAEALQALRDASQRGPVLVFKKSPICPVSGAAEAELRAWLAEGPDVEVAVVDVIADRALARGLGAQVGVEHQSPQALLFCRGELSWHASHTALTKEAFHSAVACC
jgi:bacillithiol system protein YtxJ